MKDLKSYLNDCDESLPVIHQKIIDTLNESLDLKNASNVTLIPKTITKYINMYDRGVRLLMKENSLLKVKIKDIYYRIKVGSHESAVLNPSTHTEVMSLVKSDLEVIQIEENIYHLEQCLKKIESYRKVINDYSYHFKLILEWDKFKNGE